jgi:hypothetical protein
VIKPLQVAFQRWWRQRALAGGHLAMSKDGRWGTNHATFEFISEMVGPLIAQGYRTETNLRVIEGSLHTATIDELTSDLFLVERTASDIESYVDERLVYTDFRKRHLYDYLATAAGRALAPDEAWQAFNDMALKATLVMDELATSEIPDEQTHFEYCTRRYSTVWNETYEVYRLFARLVGFTLPPHHH